MERFLLFGGQTYYPNGALEDFRKSYDTLEEAVQAAKTEEFATLDYPASFFDLDWYQVLDSSNFSVVYNSENLGSDSPQSGQLIEVQSRPSTPE